METAGEFNRELKELQSQLIRYKTVVEELTSVVDQRTKAVLQHDHAISLNNLKAKIMKEVDDAQIMDIEARDEFNKQQLTSGIMGFALGFLYGALSGQKDPLSRGARLLQSSLDQQAPFGTVLIAIGKQGLPEDVAVFTAIEFGSAVEYK